MADNTARGHVVWHELLTPDEGASHGFYAKVFGWKSQPWEHDPSYRMFAASTGPLGGTAALTEGPARWRHYIEVEDVEAITEQAVGLGATVQTPPVALSNGSRYAVLNDPQGATFCLIASANPGPAPKAPKRGEFSWMELATTDAKAALSFYDTLFGWKISQEHDMGPIGIYYLVSVDGRDFAGAFNKPSDMPGPPAWLGYVRVKNVESTVKAAKKAGGTLINGPMEVPGGDWVAQLLDPQGGMFAVHMLAADVQAAASTAQSSPAEAPATIEVTGAARSEERAAAKPAASKPAAKKASGKTESTAKAKTKSAAKPASKSKTATRTKKKSAKTLKRSSRKAVKVRSQTSRSKAKAAPQRKKSASKPKKRAAAKAKKGK